MAVAYKVLGQSNPSADTLTTAYTVPADTEAVISTIVVTNRSTTETSFRIAVLPGGGSVADTDYIYYDLPMDGNETFACTFGITLEAASIVQVYADDATLSFNIFGTEIS